MEARGLRWKGKITISGQTAAQVSAAPPAPVGRQTRSTTTPAAPVRPAQASLDDLPLDADALQAALFGPDTGDEGVVTTTAAPTHAGRKRDMETRAREQAGVSPIGPPVTRFPRIEAEFAADPVAAIKRAKAPYHGQANLDLLPEGELEAMLNWKDEAERRREDLWDDPEYVFLRLVNGATAEFTRLMPHAVASAVPLPFMSQPQQQQQQQQPQQPPRAGQQVPISQAMGPRGGRTVAVAAPGGGQTPLMVAGEPTEGGPVAFAAAGTQLADGGAQQQQQQQQQQQEEVIVAPQAPTLTEANRVQIQRGARAVADMPEVSGRMQLSDEHLAAINKSLMDLKAYNFAKFRGKERYDFYGDKTALTLLAHLTAANVIFYHVRNPSKYFKDRDDMRRRYDIKQLVAQMNVQLTWSVPRRSFVEASEEEHYMNEMLVCSRGRYKQPVPRIRR